MRHDQTTRPLAEPASRSGRSVRALLILGVPLAVCAFVALAAVEVEPNKRNRDRQTAFRVRADMTAPLNADRGWAGALNENVTVHADQPFRIRFELEGAPQADAARQFRLQYRRNGGDWAHVEAEDFPKPDEASPRVSIVSTAAFEQGATTTDLLSQADAPSRAGAGVNLAATTPPWSGGNAHGEWEWPLVIRRFADGAVTNDMGDKFEFRMVRADGGPVDSAANPVLTLSVPPRHVGGTFAETPGRLGPWEASDGDLYFIMEPSETDNVLMMVKSADAGETWQEVDGANRPSADDLEGIASDRTGDTIHVLHQTSDEVWYHSFRTSDHPTHPGTWHIRDELVATPEEPPTQVASIAVRSDGSIVGVYGGPQKVHFKIRSHEGIWGDETVLDAGSPPNLSGPQAVAGEGDVVHLAYTGDDGTAWYRRLQPDGMLTPRVLLARGLGTTEYDVGAILPLVFIPETNTVVVIYRLATGRLWERRIFADGPVSAAVAVTDRDVIQNPVDSDQAAADAIADGTTVHVLFIEQGSGSIYHTHTGANGAWTPSTRRIDGIRGQWLRGTLLTHGDGAAAYGFIYDAGSNGGSGMNRFAEVPLGDR